MTFFYRLGHIPDLGEAEFRFLQGDDYSRQNNWLFSPNFQDISKTGSLVFCGKVIAKIDAKLSTGKVYQQIQEILGDYFGEEVPKKLGVALREPLSSSILKTLKTVGVKKINLLPSNKLPTFGNFKHTKRWLIIENMGSEFFLGEVLAYFPQEFWSQMDENLPVNDMKRGIINLKLARTLANFSQKEVVWDPFAGLGRNAVAALDLKEKFFLSDKDQECTVAIEKNLDFALDRFGFTTDSSPKYEVYCSPAQEKPGLDLGDTKELAVITEGYLGKNFERKPETSEIQKQLEAQKKLWVETLRSFHKLGVEEVIFCLPFYKQAGQISKLNPGDLESHGYKVFPLLKERVDILYSRKESLVGHQIVKLMKLD